MSDLKFLVRVNSFEIFSYNKLLTEYTFGGDWKFKNGSSFGINKATALSYWISINELLGALLNMYDTNSVEKFKQLVFGDLDVDLAFDTAILGYKVDGTVVKYRYDENGRGFIEEKGEPFKIPDDYSKYRMKHEIAGSEVSTHMYSTGLVGNDIKDLKWLDSRDYVGFDCSLKMIKDMKFNDIYLSFLHWINRVENISIRTLVTSDVLCIYLSSLVIQTVLFSSIREITRSNMQIGRVRYSEIGVIDRSSIKINSAYKLGLVGNIEDSVITFDCDLNMDLLGFLSAEPVEIRNATIKFNGAIDIKELKRLLAWLLENNGIFEILIPLREYNRCKKDVDSALFLKYIKVG